MEILLVYNIVLINIPVNIIITIYINIGIYKIHHKLRAHQILVCRDIPQYIKIHMVTEIQYFSNVLYGSKDHMMQQMQYF